MYEENQDGTKKRNMFKKKWMGDGKNGEEKEDR